MIWLLLVCVVFISAPFGATGDSVVYLCWVSFLWISFYEMRRMVINWWILFDSDVGDETMSHE